MKSGDDQWARKELVDADMPESMMTGFPLTVFKVVCTPDGSQAITGDSDGRVIVWDLATGLKDRLLIDKKRHYIESLSISPDGTKLLVGSTDWTVSLLDMSTGAVLHRWMDGDAWLCLGCFSPGGRFAVIGGFTDRLFLWDLEGKTEQRSINRPWPPDELHDMVMSPDGSQIAGGYGRTGAVHVWDVNTGCLVGMLQNPFIPSLMGLGYSPDGKYILTSGGKIMLWNSQNGHPEKVISGSSEFLDVAEFSRDSLTIVAADDQYRVILFDVETGDEVQHFVGHTAMVRCHCFLPDGKHLLTSSPDGTARLWDIQTGSELMRLSPRPSA